MIKVFITLLIVILFSKATYAEECSTQANFTGEALEMHSYIEDLVSQLHELEGSLKCEEVTIWIEDECEVKAGPFEKRIVRIKIDDEYRHGASFSIYNDKVVLHADGGKIKLKKGKLEIKAKYDLNYFVGTLHEKLTIKKDKNGVLKTLKSQAWNSVTFLFKQRMTCL